MCLFEYDHDKAMQAKREEGIEKGEARERIRLLVKFIKDGILTIEQAAKEAGISVKEFQKILKERQQTE